LLEELEIDDPDSFDLKNETKERVAFVEKTLRKYGNF
jgi:hypothetical protein